MAAVLPERDPVLGFGAAYLCALGSLSERERLVLWLRFVEGMTFAALAERFGVTRSRVGQIVDRAAQKVESRTAGWDVDP